MGEGRFCFALRGQGWVLLGQKEGAKGSLLPFELVGLCIISAIIFSIAIIIIIGSAPIFWGRPAFVLCLSGFRSRPVGLLLFRSAALCSRLESGYVLNTRVLVGILVFCIFAAIRIDAGATGVNAAAVILAVSARDCARARTRRARRSQAMHLL